jgi:hypothetical protein
MKQNFKLLQTKLTTTLSVQEFQTEIEKHLARDPLLNDTWLVSTWEHAFELHGLNLHGRIQGYHFRIPNLKVEAVVTFEFRKGDEALVKHLVKLLSSPADFKVHTKPLLGQQNQNSESELAEFLNNYKSTSPEHSLHIAGTAVEAARHCSWFNEEEIVSELRFLAQMPEKSDELLLEREDYLQRHQQLCQIWPKGKTIWFREQKIKLIHQAHIVCPVTDVVLAIHFAYCPQDGKVIIGYLHQYNEI